MSLLRQTISHIITQGMFSQVGQAFLILLCTAFISASAALATSMPAQPSTGPGSIDYAHSQVTRSSHGAGALHYYIYEPDLPRPDNAPLIVFLHGWGGTDPGIYDAWIQHIVKRGNIVVFPTYQTMVTGSVQYTSNSIQAVVDSLKTLNSEGHVEPDLSRFAVVGHSCGGILAANMAALAETAGLPVPKAVMSVEPGISSSFKLEDLSTIPSNTLLLSLVGDRDGVVGASDAKNIFWNTSQIPFDNKDFIIMVSDSHGSPSLHADHFAPCCSHSNETDPLDYYCLWKLFDALTDAAFYGENREYALGNTPQQRYMGEWSDGTPVRELVVTDNP
ncbi:MAG: alpha/beta hydrolase [bacterium]